ncbi:MAG: carbohydrate binding family 9 domain-containing protein [Opitutaceae bacterium]|nr:carbohydrate binding family 9 domain-containing protein [Opitutaceae bacterium]
MRVSALRRQGSALLFLWASLAALAAPAPEKRAYTTHRLTGPAPAIDGRLDDPCWQAGEWASDFRQREPQEGAAASLPTELKIRYDDRNLYVAIRAHDPEIAALAPLRAARDEFAGDAVGLAFDSYADRRTAFEFAVTAGGNQIDSQLRNQGSDRSWNAVWESAVGSEPAAWTAEFRIPFSQLRHNGRPDQTWGLHVWRWINRRQEQTNWQLIPLDHSGFVYSFGDLRGLRDLRPSRRFEAVPYSILKFTSVPRAVGNPLLAGNSVALETGVDLKVGLGGAFTLTASVNPDFSQLEGDPSELNLSAVETFFPERRPFFLEGRNLLDFGLDNDLFFYARRLGRRPSLDPGTSGHKVVPVTTRILSATKLTGRSEGGLSIGLLHGFTARETALLAEGDRSFRTAVEPQTNYFVGRVQQEFGEGRTLVGASAALAVRRLDAPELRDQLADTSASAGLDLYHTWGDRAYFLDSRFIASRIEGAAAGIRTIAHNPVHYFQRPDAEHLPDDPEATALTGTGGRIALGRSNRGRWRYSGTFDWRTPGLELNDVGYLQSADFLRQSANLEYVVTTPGAHLRRYNFLLGGNNRQDFGGTDLGRYVRTQGGFTFNNNWTLWTHAGLATAGLDPRLLRGGPALRRPARYDTFVHLGSDGSRPWRYWVGAGQSAAVDGTGESYSVGPGTAARLGRRFNFEVRLNYAANRQDFQYAGAAAPHYVVGRMHQETLGATLRLEANLTPNLTLSYYGNPYVTTGRFATFREVVSARAGDPAERFQLIAPTLDPVADRYTTPSGSYGFDNPDFNWSELKSNLVLRWEYRPGSTLHLVWSYNGLSSDVTDRPILDEQRSLFRVPATNTILIKLSYWFSS